MAAFFAIAFNASRAFHTPLGGTLSLDAWPVSLASAPSVQGCLPPDSIALSVRASFCH
jgi:hypothetical protein